MTMALAIMIVVLIAVMGAGLLTFGMRDLNAVVEVNQGQKASEAADAGIQAAKRQLLANSFPNLYNDPATATFTPTDPANVEWAATSPSAVCGGLPSGPGKCITSASNGDTRVTIRYLPPPNGASSGPGSRLDPNYAPVDLAGQTDYPDSVDYFRIDSEAMYGNARRKIQAIYATGSLGLPVTYRTTGNIDISGAATTINNLSIFAGGNITNLRATTLTGIDSSYGNWQNSYNNKARLGTSVSSPPNNPTVTGAAAEGTITHAPTTYNATQKAPPAASSDRYKRVDFDRDSCLANIGSPTTPPCTGTQPSPNYKFCRQGTPCWPAGTSQPSNVITYPFKHNSRFDDELMQSIAKSQINPITGADNYEERSTGSSLTINDSNFNQITPAMSSVFVVRFTGPKGSVTVSPNSKTTVGGVDHCSLKGTILVINGDVSMSNSGGKCFEGVISIQDPNNLGTLQYTSNGTTSLNGFVNIEGNASIAGNTDPHILDDIINHPGFHELKLWSWRECYDTQASTGCAP